MLITFLFYCCSITHSYMTLFWSLFGLTQLTAVREGHMQPFTRRVGEYLLMAYHALAIIVLINMLIAMMSNSFQNIEVYHGKCCSSCVVSALSLPCHLVLSHLVHTRPTLHTHHTHPHRALQQTDSSCY